MNEEKRRIIEKMAAEFMQIDTVDKKAYAVICMTAYESGKEAGKAEAEAKLKESA